MRKIKISAFSLAEAKEKALEQGVSVIRNVTKSWKTSDFVDFDEFAVDALVKNKLDKTTGAGLIVVETAGSADTRMRPYKFNNVTHDGNMTKKRVFEICKVSDGIVVGSAESKFEAARVAKKLMSEIREDLICKVVYRVDKKHETAFKLDYAPSSNTTEGSYIVFAN